MRRIVTSLAVAAALALGWVALAAGPALAHEERTDGPWHVAVGFGSEPAYAGVENSVQMFLHDASDQPVVDLGPTLQVTVQFGSQSMPPMTMEPDFEVGESGIPGDYRAFFIPTRPGNYTFHFTGTIKGTTFDQSFTSSPTTFSSVIDPSSVEFPAKDPTTGELAQRLDREIPRVQASAQAAVRSAKDQASAARTIGLIGLVLGALGVIVGGLAFRSARAAKAERPRPAGPAPRSMDTKASAEAPGGRS